VNASGVLERVRSSGEGGKWIRKWIRFGGVQGLCGGTGAVRAGGVDLVLRDVGGVWSACGAW